MDEATPRPWKAVYSEFDNCWGVYPTDEAMGGAPDGGHWTEVALCRLNESDDTELDGKADAALIVKAVNCHDQLVEALERLCLVQEGVPMTGILAEQYLQNARAALKAAKGEA